MSDFDQFERRFAAALRADADLSVLPFDPASITRAVVVGARRRTMRIPWAIPRNGSGPARRLGRNPGVALLAAAAVVLVGAAAVGSGLVRLPLLVPHQVVPSSAPFASPSPTPDNGFPALSGMFDDVRSVLLASDTVGWVSTSSAIYRTRDMGTTWTEVRPPGGSTFATVRFVDADTMYLIKKEGSSDSGPLTIGGPLTIAATHDGGASWVEATIDGPPVMAGMGFSFRSADSGTLTFFTQTGNDLRVFATSDGGRTWTGPVRSSAPRMLYLLKDLSGDRAMVLTNSLTPGQPFDNNLYFSLDGGVTWAKRPFPVNHRAPAADMKGAAIWADGSGQVVLAMDVSGDTQIYTSGDDGQTWQFVRDLGRDIAGAPTHVQLLSESEWIFASSFRVLSTADGGAHWRTTETGISPYAVSFASPDRGWALLSCSDYPPADPNLLYCPAPQPSDPFNRTVFLTTRDGGSTWTPIGG